MFWSNRGGERGLGLGRDGSKAPFHPPGWRRLGRRSARLAMGACATFRAWFLIGSLDMHKRYFWMAALVFATKAAVAADGAAPPPAPDKSWFADDPAMASRPAEYEGMART